MSDPVAQAIGSLEAVDPSWLERAEEHHLRLTKPAGSLGKLEALSARLCAIQNTLAPKLEAGRVVVFAGDHGVTESQVVSPYPRSVTAQMVANFNAGGAAINALAGAVGVDLEVVDIGVATEVPEVVGAAGARLLQRRIALGTADFTRQPAMTASQLDRALAVGVERAEAASYAGMSVLALGEMGIGNSTAAAALTAALTGRSPAHVVGPGTGADELMMRRKCDVISQGLATHAEVSEPLGILCCLGGLELAGLCGLCLGAAAQRIAVVCDGYIATAAAAIAATAWPAVRGYLFAGHLSTEPGHRILLDQLELEPILQLDLRLGEGTGAVLAIPMLRAAAAAIRDMATFAQAGVDEQDS